MCAFSEPGCIPSGPGSIVACPYHMPHLSTEILRVAISLGSSAAQRRRQHGPRPAERRDGIHHRCGFRPRPVPTCHLSPRWPATLYSSRQLAATLARECCRVGSGFYYHGPLRTRGSLAGSAVMVSTASVKVVG